MDTKENRYTSKQYTSISLVSFVSFVFEHRAVLS